MRSGLLVKLLAVGVPIVLVLGAVAVVALLAVGVGARYWWARRKWAALEAQAVDLWAVGAAGIWSGSEDSAQWPEERAKSSLQSWYGATDAASLNKTIEGLVAGATGNPGWDLVRAVDLVRMGLAAGYYDLEAGRSWTRRLAVHLRKAYASWEEAAAGFEQGMAAWQASRNITNPVETGRVQRNLPVLRTAVWPQIPWGASL